MAEKEKEQNFTKNIFSDDESDVDKEMIKNNKRKNDNNNDDISEHDAKNIEMSRKRKKINNTNTNINKEGQEDNEHNHFDDNNDEEEHEEEAEEDIEGREEEDDDDDDGDDGEEEDYEDEEDENLLYENSTYNNNKDMIESGSKKRRIGKNKYLSTFLDTEAQVGDDDEEEEYESSYIDEFEEAKRLEKKKLYEQKLKSGTNHLAQAINKLSKRYENEKEVKEDDILTDGETLTDGEILGDDYSDERRERLQTIDSPKMWLIKLFKNNVERNLAIGIYHKFMKLKDNDFNIKGIYVSDNLKGYIYIEADSLYMLKKFLLGFKFINLNEISIVPIQELTSIFTMCHSKINIPKVNEYVRIKRGLYINDIGQIYEIHEKGIYAIVRLIPRITYEHFMNAKKSKYYNQKSSLNKLTSIIDKNNKSNSYYFNDKLDMNRSSNFSKYPNDDMSNGYMSNGYASNGYASNGYASNEYLSNAYASNEDMGNGYINDDYLTNVHDEENLKKKTKQKKKKDSLDEALQLRKKKKERPLQKLFDRDEIERIGGVIETGPYPRTIKYQNNIFEENGYILKKMNIKYLITENANITLTEIREFNKNNGMAGEKATLGITKSFINKNSLHLFKKDERVKILKGELCNLIGTITAVNDNVLTINPDNLAKQFKFLPSDVTKYFIEGDNVTVINGLHKGKSGLISLIDYKENVALIFSPSLNTELRCSIQDLSLSINNSEGLGGVHTLNGFSVGDLIELNDRQIGVLTYIDKNKHIRVLTNNNTTLHTTIGCITSKRSAVGQVGRDENNNIVQSRDNIQIVRGAHRNKVAVIMYIWKNKIFGKINKKIEDNGFVVLECQNCSLVGNPAEKKKIITNNNLFRSNTNYLRKNNNFNSFIGKTVKILTGVYKGLLADVIDAERDEFTLLLKIKPKTVRQKRIECAISDSYKDQNACEENDEMDIENKNKLKPLQMFQLSDQKKNKFHDSFYNPREKKSFDKLPPKHFSIDSTNNQRNYYNYGDKWSYANNNNNNNNNNNMNGNVYTSPHKYSHNDNRHNHYDNRYNHHDNRYNHHDNRYNHHDNRYNHHDNRYNHHDNRYNNKDNPDFKKKDYKSNNNHYEDDYLKKKHSINNFRDSSNNIKHEEHKNYVTHIGEENKKHHNKYETKKEYNNIIPNKINNNDQKEESPIWLHIDIMVKVITPGPFYNEIGKIIDVITKNAYTILKIQTDKTTFNIVADAVVPLKPQKKNDHILIFDKEEKIEGTVQDIKINEVHANTASGLLTCHLKNTFLYKNYIP
ncbi:hypothetical protein PFDG_03519 [Plasmodium falciparum Dd2]|uniref:KOW domain-containing protein n=3 Tax=Plasmodium falciparum TaxID=5833 RepID=A0A024XCE3_PLAFC|nr:hypothetical protein PFMC_01372 [Plasmodium falciparum CAMP/Malaysia]KOB88755.1 hypothetical protein PFDG_03519 [Plasmodium falciparum Dd2]